MATRTNLSADASRATKVRVPSRWSALRLDVDTLGLIAMLCGAGLLIAMLLAVGGLDLSVGF